MRFDDTLDTVLSADLSTPFGRQAAWRQLVDLIGRGRAEPASQAIATLKMIRADVPPPIRAATARMLEFADPPEPLARMFVLDELPIALPVVRSAKLSSAQWITLLPMMAPAARSVLRHRRDLASDVVRALESYGPSDMVLGDDNAATRAELPPVEQAAEDAPAPVETEWPDLGSVAVEQVDTAADDVARLPDMVPTEPEHLASEALESPGAMAHVDDHAEHEPASRFVRLGAIALNLPVVAEAVRLAQDETENMRGESDADPAEAISLPLVTTPSESIEETPNTQSALRLSESFIDGTGDALVDMSDAPVEHVPDASPIAGSYDDEDEATSKPEPVILDGGALGLAMMVANWVGRPNIAPSATEVSPAVTAPLEAAQGEATEEVAPTADFADGIDSRGASEPVTLKAEAQVEAESELLAETEKVDPLANHFADDSDDHRRRIPDPEPDADAVGAEAEAAEAEAAEADVEADDLDTDDGSFRIVDVMARLDAFRQRQPDMPVLAPVVTATGEGFRFETDAHGVIRWIDGVTRGAIVGMALDQTAQPAGTGFDASVAGAFRRRASFDKARLLVAGDSDASGNWLVAGVPGFDPATGRFTGYRGSARRPRIDERADPIAIARPHPTDSLRELVHELRTPAGAITGFAELIESQMLGPVPEAYRERAMAIRTEARELLAIVEDLDLAARIESRALDLRPGNVPLQPMLASIFDQLQPLASMRHATLMVPMTDQVVHGDQRAIDRLLTRLMTSVVGASTAGDQLSVTVSRETPETIGIEITRPAGLDVEASADNGEGGDVAFGSGFGLRLSGNLARELGGALVIAPDRLTLRLPAADDPLVEQVVHQ